MNILEVQKFFNTMVSEAILFPDRAALFRSLGCDPMEWPDGDARKIMQEFHEAVRARGEDAARLSFTERIGRLDALEALPEDQGELAASYDRARVVGQALQLSERIRQAPMDLDRILDDFKRKRTNRVESFILADALDEVMSQQSKKIEKNELRVLIPRWEKLSKKIGGFNPGRVSMLVAGTGVGKTMLALNLADCASDLMSVLFVNMEMSKEDMVSRCLQLGARIRSEDWYTGKWNFATIAEYREKVREKRKPIIMTNGRALTLNQIIGQIIIAREQQGIQFVIIDYDQKIRTGGREEEWRQLQHAIEDLEECAKANSIHIMVLAQGDDEGQVKASKRAQQPAATIFEFFETNGKYGLRSRKNRFGARRWRMSVECEPSMSLVSEGEIVDDAQMELKTTDGSSPDQWWNK